MKYLLLPAAVAAITFMLSSCRQPDLDRDNALFIYNHRDYLLKEFKDRSVSGRGKTFYILSFHKDHLENSWYFRKNEDSILFTRDTLQFPVTDIVLTDGAGKIANTESFIKSGRELERLLKIMDRFAIHFFISEWEVPGIDLKLFFGDWSGLLYVKDISLVKEGVWRNYVLSGERIDEHWYYVKDRKED